MKPRLYLETTIPSYLVARRSRDLRLAADQESTQQWWESERHDFSLFMSTAVLNEVRRGDPDYAAAREAKLAGVPLLGELASANELAKRLLRDEIIPAVAADDATHVALAAAHRMDFLLSVWPETPLFGNDARRRGLRAGIQRLTSSLHSPKCLFFSGDDDTSPVGLASRFRSGGFSRRRAPVVPVRSCAGCSSSPRSPRSAGSLAVPRPGSGSIRVVPGC